MMTSVKSMPSIEIHLVSWNRPAMTELVVRSLRRNTNRENYSLVVFDNNSEHETQSMLADLYEEGLIDSLRYWETNIGLEAARQKMLEDSVSEYIVCLDNDCVPPPYDFNGDWLTKLYYLMEAHEDYGAIAAKTQVMIGTGNIFDGKENDSVVEFPHPGGSFRMMRTKPTLEVGGWTNGNPGRGSEERLVCGRLRDAGWKTAFTPQVECLHLFGVRANGTDRWGYPEDWAPEKTGHSDIWHPALEQGDDFNQVRRFSGEELAGRYFYGDSYNPKY